MSSEERMMLDAVIAEPANDAVRLIFADWLEENDQPTRAEFIRVQIEAEQQQHGSAARAELEGRGHELLAENWCAWWAPVCAAIGWRTPILPSRTRLGRIVQATGLNRAGSPFKLEQPCWVQPPYSPWQIHLAPWAAQLFDWSGFNGAGFRQGFPESIRVSGGGPATGEWGRRWATVSPIRNLELTDFTGAVWDEFDGPHLAGITACSLRNFAQDGVERFAASSHIKNIDTFELSPATSWHVRFFRQEWFRRLQSLTVVLRENEDAAALADQPLVNMTTLTVELAGSTGPDDRLQRLAASPHLRGLRDLRIVASRDPVALRELRNISHLPRIDDFHPIVAAPAWRGLRRLTITSRVEAAGIRSLTEWANLPDLEELRFTTPPRIHGADYLEGRRVEPHRDETGAHQSLDAEGLRLLAASPLLKQLRLLQIPVNGRVNDEVIAFADAVIPTRLEMLCIETNGIDWRWKKPVRKRLGPRVKMIRS